MKRLSLTILSLAAAGALTVAPVAAQTYASKAPVAKTRVARQVKPADDKALTDRIAAKLKAEASLKKFDVDVSVNNGVATLTGKVRTEAEKVRAGRDAHVPGVTRVDNQISLDKDAGKGVAESAKQTSKNVAESVKDTSKTAGEKTKQAVSKTGEVITDSWITTKVHAGFMGEDLLKGSDINVDTTNHVVTLKGTVKSDAGRARAMQIARSTEGVTRVVDALKTAK